MNLEINDPDVLNDIGFDYFFKTPQYDNGFVRDSGNGLLYEGCLADDEDEPTPVNQTKSSDEDILKTVHGFLALQRGLEGIFEVEINDLEDSVFLKNSPFRQQYDIITAECEPCSQLEERRTANYMNGSSITYEKNETVQDISAVENCSVDEENQVVIV